MLQIVENTVYLVVSIDTECDKSVDWSIRQPLSFHAVTHGIPDVLTPLFETYTVKPTYLLSPEVLANDECVTTLKSISHCELGTHLHGEFIEPEANFNAQRTSIPQLAYRPEVERQKLLNLTKLFKDKLGYVPTSFRAGRFGISSHTMAFLSELGYLVDSSIAPFWIHRFDERVNDHWGAPLQPYFPDGKDPRKKGNLPILQVPVTIVNTVCMKWPRWFLRRMNTKPRGYRRFLNKLQIKIPPSIWLRPQRSTAEEMIAIADLLIRQTSDRQVILNMMYHNVEVIPGASPYAQTNDDVNYIIQSQAILFKHLRNNYVLKPIGLSETADLFKGMQ